MGAHQQVSREVDPASFRDVLGHFCSGITVLSARGDAGPVGMTCQSFFSVSLDPPLVAWSVGASSTTYPLIREVGSLVVNVLAGDQHEISNGFARSGTDKWAGVPWTESPTMGHPAIDGALAHIECSIVNEVPAGDHTIVVAQVAHLWADRTLSPLLYFQGGYRRLEAAAAALLVS